MIDFISSRARLTVGLALILSAIGLASWFLMPREEDPRLEERFGLVVTAYPGADAKSVERLVTDPIEEELAEVDTIKNVRSTIRSGVVVTQVELLDDVEDMSEAWSDVEDALARAQPDLPEGVLAPRLDHQLNETEGVVVAVTGNEDRLVLAEAADALERRLLADPEVSRVVQTGDPGEQITVQWDDWQARELGVGVGDVARMLTERNVTIPSGSLEVDGQSLDVRPSAEFGSVQEIRETPLVLRSGAGVRLGDLTKVQRTPRDPAQELARHDGRPAVLVGVVPRDGIDVVDFGHRIRERLEAFDAERQDVNLELVAFQPEKVEGRLADLSRSLLLGIAIVALVLVLSMGIRLGLVVAMAVPLVTFAGVAIYAAGGGVLHQIAVAALVIALGLLVDNAIVVAEAIQRRLDEGQSRPEAVRASVRELAVPLATATATTLAAFVPMMLSEGASADFTRAIPLVVMVTLGASYFYALVITPAVAGTALRRTRTRREGIMRPISRWIGRVGPRHPWLVLGLSALILAAEGWAASRVKFAFFPSSDREQMVVQVQMPEGTHLNRTDDVTRRLEAAISQDPEVKAVTAVVGRSVPSFYYNLTRAPSSPHLAQLIVTTTGRPSVTRLEEDLRRIAHARFPEATIIPQRLEQGPPVRAPVEIRLAGDDLGQLHDSGTRIRRIVRDTDGARDVRTDDGLGVAVVAIEVNDAHAQRYGLDRRAVSQSLLGRTRGAPAGVYRGGDDPIPIVVRSSAGERNTLEALTSADVAAPGVPLMEVAQAGVETKPAVIRHRNRTRVVSVLAEVEPGYTYADVVAAIVPQLEQESFEGVTWTVGGATEKSLEANQSLASKAPLGILLLIAVLLAEFNSFRRVSIILTTAPLAAMGIWPGLMLAGLPFGFVALLGAIALIGIVVNAAIVLIDVADRQREAGATTTDALATALELRTRPILLTTATTVAGLLPLGFSESTLWPPMAWSMISGLVIATVLSLFVVPALYRLLVREPKGDAA